MVSPRQSNSAGRSSTGKVDENDFGATENSSTNILNESIALDSKDLLAMLAGDEDKEEQEEEEGLGGWTMKTALDDQFAGATSSAGQVELESELKRKRDDADEAGTTTSEEPPARRPATVPIAHGSAAPAATTATGKLLRTVVRIRKVGPQVGALSLSLDQGSSTTLTTINPYPGTSRAASHSFVSDKVLDASVGQAAVFCEVEPIVRGLFEDQPTDGLVVLQGASGSGKTYTSMGSGGDVAAPSGTDVLEGDGILPRALERMYRQLDQSEPREGNHSGRESRTISVRAIEVYNNKPYDLLEGEKATIRGEEGDLHLRWKGGARSRLKDKERAQPREPLDIKQGKDGEDVIPELTAEFPADFAAALACAKKARSRSRVNRTRLNEKSSRGHVLFFLGVHSGGGGSTAADIPRCDPVMVVCDLAGSERQRAALHNDGSRNANSRATEANHINRDISNLFAVWKLVNDGANYVSCRGRTLTRLLKRLFVRSEGSPRMNCTMIVCVNPAASEYKETQQVLTNSNISSRVKSAVVQGLPTRKRQKVGNRAAAPSGGGSLERELARRIALATASASAEERLTGIASVNAPAVASQDDEGAVAELRKEIERLLDEMARLKEGHKAELLEQRARLEEEHEIELVETERFATEEGQEAAQELEREVARLRHEKMHLRQQLDSKYAVDVDAREVLAQSVRKQKARLAESARALERETTREADDEVTRQSNERARAEKELAAALAENVVLKASVDRETSRANEKDALAERLGNERFQERSTRMRLEDENQRLRAAVVAEAKRARDLEEKLLEEGRKERDVACLEGNDRPEVSAPAVSCAARVITDDISDGGVPSPEADGGCEEDACGSAQPDPSTSGIALAELGDGGQRSAGQGDPPAGELGDLEMGENEHRELDAPLSDCSLSDSGSRRGSVTCEGDSPGDSGSHWGSATRAGGESRVGEEQQEAKRQKGDGGDKVEAMQPPQPPQPPQSPQPPPPPAAATVAGVEASHSSPSRTRGASGEDDAGFFEEVSISTVEKEQEEEEGRQEHGELEVRSEESKKSKGKRRRLGMVEEERSRRSTRIARKPLTNIQNDAKATRASGKDGGKKNTHIGVDGRRPMITEDGSSDEEAREEEENGKQAAKRRFGLRGPRGRGTKSSESVADKNSRKASERAEKSLCRELRKNARLSKPSPEAALSKQQTKKARSLRERLRR